MTAFLLDSHVALWLLAGVPVSPSSHTAVTNPANQVFLSIASVWEIAVKQGSGKLDVDDDYLDVLESQGVGLLAIDRWHASAVRGLPMHHRDPFDRMLVAQAQVERLTVVTRDEKLALYDIRVLVA